MTKLQVIVGGQYGSEAKGHIAGYLAGNAPSGLAVRVAGPNAGHSVVNPATKTKHALRQIPVAAVTNPSATLYIAAGSEISIDVLSSEIEMLEADGVCVRGRLLIDRAATVIMPSDVETEVSEHLVELIGSTGKGIGAARARRAMRQAFTVRDLVGDHKEPLFGVETVDRHGIWSKHWGPLIQIEGTQGYGLGLHTNNYPQVTSSDCTAMDFLAMAGLAPWGFAELEIWVVYRPYPIRVAGNSGPLHSETTWDELGLMPEYTTVTKKKRRVGRWDNRLAVEAYRANGGPHSEVHVALTMADQLDPTVEGTTAASVLRSSVPVSRHIAMMRDSLRQPELVATSPSTIVDLR